MAVVAVFGLPGSGKSTLCATIIENLDTLFGQMDESSTKKEAEFRVVAFAFDDFTDSTEQFDFVRWRSQRNAAWTELSTACHTSNSYH